MTIKPRRLRQSSAIRALVAENGLHVSGLVYPVFLQSGLVKPEAVQSMPGQLRYSPEDFLPVMEKLLEKGIRSVLLFGVTGDKDEGAAGCYDPDGAVPSAVRLLREKFPEVTVMTDVCVCGYTSHGHCGLTGGSGKTGKQSGSNDFSPRLSERATNDVLAKMALCHAEAGAQVVAPSAMMDNQVGAIREVLDNNGYGDTLIMAYSAKYYSAFYGPFRDAASSAPQFGDRAGYQMDPANINEAMKEMELDAEQGADILMVKPALPYLDVIARARERFDLPIAAYNVSGTYSMIMAATEKGWINKDDVMLEMAMSIRRAGATVLITYFAPELAELINKNKL